MRIDISELLREAGASLTRILTMAAADLCQGAVEDAALSGTVQVALTVTNTGEGIEVEGRIGCAAALVCSRCLEAFPHWLDVRFYERYRPEGAVYQAQADEDEVFTYSGNSIDIGAAVREHLLLALPMKPLCQEACLGLCQECGADLKRGLCACAGRDPGAGEAVEGQEE
ncbi:MAG: DUF177 domain-containing protein [Bacillota bacterium]